MVLPRSLNRSDKPPVLTARQVNLALEALLVVSVATGVLSWGVPLAWARPFTALHAISGLSMVVLAPLKLRGSVRTGFRRGRDTRWLSTGFGALILAAVVLGVAHSTGLWYGVGLWSPLWTHLLFGFSAVPLAIWHTRSRPVRPGRTDLSRRALLSGGALTGTAAVAVGAQELLVRIVGLDGAHRAGTGSHETASLDPASMPVVSWLDDTAPRIEDGDWSLVIQGRPTDPASIAATTTSIDAALDCTGGWRSTQRWDVVSLGALLEEQGVGGVAGRSIKATSATGYSRLFSRSAADSVYLCTGYGGEPLRRGHGGPIRIVAPGRRGPWWVKWVVELEITDRPAWLQLPFPPT